MKNFPAKNSETDFAKKFCTHYQSVLLGRIIMFVSSHIPLFANRLSLTMHIDIYELNN